MRKCGFKAEDLISYDIRFTWINLMKCHKGKTFCMKWVIERTLGDFSGDASQMLQRVQIRIDENLQDSRDDIAG